MYKIIGYYICEFIQIPQYLNRKGSMISVSECFGGTHPRLDTCFFINNYITAQERDAYKKLWNLTEEKITQLTKEISFLLEKGLAVDGCFSRLSDARYFYDSFFSGENSILVSVSTKEKYWEILKEEWTDSDCGRQSLTTDYEDKNELLGIDILGWDIGGFHYFLCNRLDKMLPAASFNSYGLLENTFDEAADFSSQIQGYGEPVIWIPCRIGKCA